MNSDNYRHPSDEPSIMHLKMTDKYDRDWGNDHTSTMLQKKQMMEQGIDLKHPINYKPQHVRSATGIVIGVVLGMLLSVVFAAAVMFLWRHFE
jgi:hypothetical protein